MGLKDTLLALNKIKSEGIIQDYAIIGGYAVIFHSVPYSTFDMDVGIILRDEKDFHRLYEYFRSRGNRIEDVYIYIADTPVQFLPDYISPLYREAIEKAQIVSIEDVKSKVARVEHLIVLALDIYRTKDKYRIMQLINKVDKKLLEDIITRYDNKEGKLRGRYKEILA